MKSFLRQIISQKHRKVLRSLADRVDECINRSAASVVNILPAGIKIFLKSRLKVIKKMDYARGQVLLDVSSALEYQVRLHSCRKEPETVEWIETFFKDKDVFFDVGANVGAYSLLAAECFKGKISVYAFEPSFLNFPQLCNNIHINSYPQSISPFNIAFTDKTSIDYFNYMNFVVGGATHTLGEAKDGHQDISMPVHRQATLGYTMDDFIKTFKLPLPQHIKLDVDGNEWQILQGAKETLGSAAVKSMLIEMGEEEGIKIKKYLAEKGFKLHSQHIQGPPEAKFFNCIFKK